MVLTSGSLVLFFNFSTIFEAIANFLHENIDISTQINKEMKIFYYYHQSHVPKYKQKR